MNRGSVFFDKKSRYNEVNNNNIVFLTPRQVIDLDIGITERKWKTDELDEEYPFLVDILKEMVKETTIGCCNGSEVSMPVEDSTAHLTVCLEIHGKLCKLQSEEWDFTKGLSGLPLESQLKTFQRLLQSGQITLDDLAAEDINNDIYKKLVVNDIDGAKMCVQKCEQIDRWKSAQDKDEEYQQKKAKLIKNL